MFICHFHFRINFPKKKKKSGEKVAFGSLFSANCLFLTIYVFLEGDKHMADDHQVKDVRTDLRKAFCDITKSRFFTTVLVWVIQQTHYKERPEQWKGIFFRGGNSVQENTGSVNFAKYGTLKILRAPPLRAVVVPRLTTKWLYSYEKLIKNETLLK